MFVTTLLTVHALGVDDKCPKVVHRTSCGLQKKLAGNLAVFMLATAINARQLAAAGGQPAFA